MVKDLGFCSVLPLGTWGVHKYVAILKQALPRGAPTPQPPRMLHKAAVAIFFFTIVGALLVGGSEVLKEYAKIVKFLFFSQFRYLLCSPGCPLNYILPASTPLSNGITGMRLTQPTCKILNQF